MEKTFQRKKTIQHQSYKKMNINLQRTNSVHKLYVAGNLIIHCDVKVKIEIIFNCPQCTIATVRACERYMYGLLAHLITIIYSLQQLLNLQQPTCAANASVALKLNQVYRHDGRYINVYYDDTQTTLTQKQIIHRLF